MTNDLIFKKTVQGVPKEVTVFTTKLEHSLDKKLQYLQIPITKQKRDTADPKTKMLDLKIIKEHFAVVGYIEKTNGTSALTQKNNLMAIMSAGGTFTMTIEAGDVICNCDKIKFTQVPMDEDPPSKYLVELSAIRGEDQ